MLPGASTIEIIRHGPDFRPYTHRRNVISLGRTLIVRLHVRLRSKVDVVFLIVRCAGCKRHALLHLGPTIALKHRIMGMAAIYTMPAARPHLTIAAFQV